MLQESKPCMQWVSAVHVGIWYNLNMHAYNVCMMAIYFLSHPLFKCDTGLSVWGGCNSMFAISVRV
jgi:hypothetical protein